LSKKNKIIITLFYCIKSNFKKFKVNFKGSREQVRVWRLARRRRPAVESVSWPRSKNRGAEEYYHGYKHNSCGADVAHEYASNRARFFSFLAMSPQNVTLSYTSALLLHISLQQRRLK